MRENFDCDNHPNLKQDMTKVRSRVCGEASVCSDLLVFVALTKGANVFTFALLLLPFRKVEI